MSHVVLVIPTIDRIGGAEQQVLTLAHGLQRQGWRVTVVALAGSGGAARQDLERDNIGYLSLEMRKGIVDPRGWLRLRAWLRHHKPDVVHAHLPHAVWMARLARLLAPIPVVIDTIHTTATGGPGRKFGYIFTRRLTDRVIAVSQAVADAYCRADIVDPQRLTVIPNSIDIKAWRKASDTRATLRSEMCFGDEFVWLAAARLEPVKDFPTMLRAFARLHSPARLVIAGDGLERQHLVSLAERLGIARQVQFIGFVRDMLPLMQAADGFLLTSLWEGLPVAVLEAAACKLPPVATRVRGTCEVIEDGVTGLLAAPGDYADIAQAMNRMMAMSNEQRSAMGQRGFDKVKAQFSLETALDRHEALYRGLLSSKRSAGRPASDSHEAVLQSPAPGKADASSRA